MKHTSGPWLLADDNSPFVYVLNKKHTNRFWLNVSSSRQKHEAQDAELLANARLIAAAPEMYEVLKEVSELVFAPDLSSSAKKLISKIDNGE